MSAAATLVRHDEWRNQYNGRIGRMILSLTGLTGGNDTIALPFGIFPGAPLQVTYEGTAGQPASSWKAADANNLYVICAGATANACVEYVVPA